MTDPTNEELDPRTEEAKAKYEESIKHISEDDVTVAAQSGEAKINALEKAIPKALSTLWSDTKLLVSMVQNYVYGKYRDVPFTAISSIAAAVLYFVSPFDVIPDFIPVLGYVDDASVLALCMRLVHNDIDKFRSWKQSRDVLEHKPEADHPPTS